MHHFDLRLLIVLAIVIGMFAIPAAVLWWDARTKTRVAGASERDSRADRSTARSPDTAPTP